MGSIPVLSTMNEKDVRDIERDFADVITGELHGFKVGQRQFYIYPITLAKVFKSQRMMQKVGINLKLVKLNPYLEALRITETKKEECCKLLALHTIPNTQDSFLDSSMLKDHAEFLLKNLSSEAMAMIFLYTLTSERTEEIIKHFGIDKEREKMSKVMEIKVKNSKNNISLGGKSLFGTFIGQLHEMGYSDNEILYERSYCYLRLMLADKVSSVYLSDEELQSLPTWAGGTLLMADDPNNTQAISDYLAKKGITING